MLNPLNFFIYCKLFVMHRIVTAYFTDFISYYNTLTSMSGGTELVLPQHESFVFEEVNETYQVTNTVDVVRTVDVAFG